MINFHIFIIIPILLISCKNVTVSNIKNLYDTDGKLIPTGELNVLFYEGIYYMVMDNWGGCNDEGCHVGTCVYAQNHTITLYSTKDFEEFVNHGVILNASQLDPPAMIFRPKLKYNEKTKLFVLWYESRRNSDDYAVATSSNVLGPYKTVIDPVKFGRCRPGGDYDIFVDTDQTAYIILTHYSYMCVEQLDDTYTKGTGKGFEIQCPENSEAPVMFKRDSIYYILFGKCCCACTEGSNIYVFTSTEGPLGKYTYQDDIGTDKNGTFTTRSQQSVVFQTQKDNYVWVGNNWGSDLKTHQYNHDLLYFYPLEWVDDSSKIEHVEWRDSVTFEV